MKSFTKNVLVASLLLASTSTLANFTISEGPTGKGEQSTETFSWMSFAPSELYFKNDTTGGKAISVMVAYVTKDKESGEYVPKINPIVLNPGQTKLLTLNGDDALVKVYAETLEPGSISIPFLSLNLCTVNNQYYNPSSSSESDKGKSRKDITFIGGKTTPVMTSYPTDQLKKDGYNKLNIENAECWIDQLPSPSQLQSQSQGSGSGQPQIQPGLENTLS